MGEMGEFFGTLLNGVILSLGALFSAHWTNNRKKAILINKLSNKNYKWRSFEALRRAIREDEETTRRLLIDIGASASTKEKNMWTLEREE